jgi:glycosyltransferase involved in cell wall biosynthesis
LPTAFAREVRDGAPRVFLAASPLARKGVFELRDALRDRDIVLVVPPGDAEPDFAQGLRIERAASYAEGLRTADVVALPAWVEHQPRGLLAAIAAGIPVVATPACGLGDDLSWHRVEAGNANDLRLAIDAAIDEAQAAGDTSEALTRTAHS